MYYFIFNMFNLFHITPVFNSAYLILCQLPIVKLCQMNKKDNSIWTVQLKA